MSAPIAGLKGKWLEAIQSGLTAVQVRGSPDDFSARINNLLADVVVSVSRDDTRIPTGASQAECLAFIRTRYSGLFGNNGQVDEVCEWYAAAHARQAKLSDVRRQEDWATFWDHARTFLFRTMTTVMIAAVVLTTGYLAHQWDIPLPMLRIP